MYIYLYYFLRFYPLIWYALTLYRIVEYYSFTKKVCKLLLNAFHKAFQHAKKSEEVEEIYEMILMTEPDKSITIDDTKYAKYYAGDEEITVTDEWYGVEV